MPTRSHHRSRSSIDRVVDLLADLDDGQVALLLEDLNHTTASNVPVNKAIDFFETTATVDRNNAVLPVAATLSPPPRAKRLPFLPRRRSSKRISSAPAAASYEDSEPVRPKTATCPQSPRILEMPEMLELETHVMTTGMRNVTLRGYKRISRPVPMLPNPPASPDLRDLLAAYLCDTPLDLASSSPSSISSLSSRSASAFSVEEESGPWVDLLEPSPARMPPQGAAAAFGFKEPTRNISGIFEVLSSR